MGIMAFFITVVTSDLAEVLGLLPAILAIFFPIGVAFIFEAKMLASHYSRLSL